MKTWSRVKAIPDRDDPAVAPGQFRRDDEHGGISKAVRFAMNVIQLIKTSKIK
jgi:hypothetical protein